MGWYQIMKPTVITEESDTPIGQMCIDVFGTGWGSFKIAHMSTGDRIGVEMFEFTNNERPKDFRVLENEHVPFLCAGPRHRRTCRKNRGKWRKTENANS